MTPTRRQVLDHLRGGPALFVGLPGDEVDVDRLAAHLEVRGFEGGLYAADEMGEALRWIGSGAPAETWTFEAGGEDDVLPAAAGADLLRDLAARGGTVSVFAGALPEEQPSSPWLTPSTPPFEKAAHGRVEQFAVFTPHPETVASPSAPPVTPRAEQDGRTAPPAVAAAEGIAPGTEGGAEPPPVTVEPPARPWPAILPEVAARVVHHRGPRLGAIFAGALARALAEHGGRVEDGRIVAPDLPESTWRVVVEAACAPIVAVAGRAFVDRTIAAAERSVQASDGTYEGAPS